MKGIPSAINSSHFASTSSTGIAKEMPGQGKDFALKQKHRQIGAAAHCDGFAIGDLEFDLEAEMPSVPVWRFWPTADWKPKAIETPVTLRKAFEPIDDSLPHARRILIFDRTVDGLLLAVHRRLFPAHPGPGKKHSQRAAHVLVIYRHGAGRWCPSQNSGNHEIAYPRMQLGRANRDFALEMLSQRLLIQGLAGLGVDHQLTNLLLRNPQRDQGFDITGLFRGRYESFSPAAARHSRHSTSPNIDRKKRIDGTGLASLGYLRTARTRPKVGQARAYLASLL